MVLFERFAAILVKDVRIISRRPSDLALLSLIPISTSLLGSLTSPLLGLVLTSMMISVQLGFMGTIREEELGVLDGMRLAPVSPILHHLSRVMINAALLALGITVYSLFILALGNHAPLDPLGASSMILFFSSTSSLASSMVTYATSRSPLSVILNVVLSLGFSLSMITGYIDYTTISTAIVMLLISIALSQYLR